MSFTAIFYFEEKCVGRRGRFPTTKCKTYLDCDERAGLPDCEKGIFDIITKNCSVQDTTSPCQGIVVF